MDESRAGRINMLRQFLSEDEHDHFSRYALALESMVDDAADASIQLEELVRRNPDFLAAYYQLGLALERTGRATEALSIYRKGIDIARVQNNLKTEQELKTAAALLAEDE